MRPAPTTPSLNISVTARASEIAGGADPPSGRAPARGPECRPVPGNACTMRFDDGPTKRDVAKRIFTRSCWRPPGCRAFVEVNEFVLKALGKGCRFLTAPGATGNGLPTFNGEQRRQIPHERRRK